MLDSIKGLHIEPTNICTLKCPRCSRTTFLDKFKSKNWSNKQLDLKELQNFVDIDIQGKIFNLCGNDGDPIYYDQLFELIEWVKSNNGLVQIHTNGSYKDQVWWSELAELLTVDDKITFAIDGTPENFTKYRINANWTSILVGIEAMVSSKVKVEWKYIPFSYNIDSIETARQLSQDLGFDLFTIYHSDRWDSDNDPYKPNIDDQGPRYERIVDWRQGKNVKIDAQCKSSHKEHYITADGYYTPCCYSANYQFFYSSDFYKNRKDYKISNTTLTKVLTNLADFYATIETVKPKYCSFNCPKT